MGCVDCAVRWGRCIICARVVSNHNNIVMLTCRSRPSPASPLNAKPNTLPLKLKHGVHILQEHIPNQPLPLAKRSPSNDIGQASAISELSANVVSGLDVVRDAAEGELHLSRAVAGDSEALRSVCAVASDELVELHGVVARHEDVGGAGVDDGGAARHACSITVHAGVLHGDLPEALRVLDSGDVVQITLVPRCVWLAEVESACVRAAVGSSP